MEKIRSPRWNKGYSLSQKEAISRSDFLDKGALKRAAAPIAEISLRACLTRVAAGLLRRAKAPRMGYRK